MTYQEYKIQQTSEKVQDRVRILLAIFPVTEEDNSPVIRQLDCACYEFLSLESSLPLEPWQD